MNDTNKLFVELIRVAIGTQDVLSIAPSVQDWKVLYEMAKKQSLVGICFAGVQKSFSHSPYRSTDSEQASGEDPSVIGMPKMLYLTWMGMAAKIQQRNEQMNEYTKKVLAHFREKGFPCTSLKGQGIARLYASLSGLRQSGDVDVWISGGRKNLYLHTIKMYGYLGSLTYHHIAYPYIEDCEVEAHIWPSFLSSPFRNHRLQVYFKHHEPVDGCDDVPCLAFNRVFILLHCYQHFTRRGVGLRQILDYFFVLRASYEISNKNYKADSMNMISTLGMKRFAEAMMWIMKDIFGLEDKYLLCEPDERYGKFLLDEVMQTGNMGHSDERVDKKQLQSAFGRFWNNLKRDIRIMNICPHKAFWEPLWGIYQFAWCKLTQLKYKRSNL